MLPSAKAQSFTARSCQASGVLSQDGPFLQDKTSKGYLNPYVLLIVGILLSSGVLTYHLLGFKQHLKAAESKLHQHVENLKFSEQFAKLDEQMSVTAREAMQGHDRKLLVRYLENETAMQKLLNDRFHAESSDPQAQKILLELKRTFRDLMKLEGEGINKEDQPYFMTPEYFKAREKIRTYLRQLNERILVSNDTPMRSIHMLNEQFSERNQTIVLGLILFWIVFGTSLIFLKRSYDEARIERSRERNALEALVQSMPNGVAAIDAHGKFTLWNKAARDLLPNGPTSLPERHLMMTENVQQEAVEIKIEGKLLRLIGAPLKDFDGSKMGTILVFEDITLHRQIEQELDAERQRRAHASKMATLGEVAGNLAHEINTPLATVHLSLDGMRKSLDNDDKKSVETYMHCVLQAAKRMGAIVSAFRRYSRVDGKQEESELMDLREVLSDALEICAPDLRAKGIMLQKNIPNRPLVASCKPGSLSQAIINLMTNARDAAGEVPKGWVKLSLSESKGWVMIDVEDAGRGLQKEVEAHIYDPFFSTKSRGKGSGIGLGIVRDVALAHGGRVKHGIRNGHTCFEISFPATSSSRIKTPVS